MEKKTIEELKTEFAQVGEFKDGMAIVQAENGLYGVVNEYGNMILECEYASITSPFERGLLVCDEEGKYGYARVTDPASVTEPEYIPCKYDDLTPSTEGTMIAHQHVEYEEDPNLRNSKIIVEERYGYVYEDGTRTSCQYAEVKPFHNGFAPVCHRDKEGRMLWGLIKPPHTVEFSPTASLAAPEEFFAFFYDEKKFKKAFTADSFVRAPVRYYYGYGLDMSTKKERDQAHSEDKAVDLILHVIKIKITEAVKNLGISEADARKEIERLYEDAKKRVDYLQSAQAQAERRNEKERAAQDALRDVEI